MALEIGKMDNKSSGVLFKTLLQPPMTAKPRFRKISVGSRPFMAHDVSFDPANPQQNQILGIKARRRRITWSERLQQMPRLPSKVNLLPIPEGRRGSLPYTRKLDLTQEPIAPRPRARKYKILVSSNRTGNRMHDTVKEWGVQGDFDMADFYKKEKIIEHVPPLDTWRKCARLVKLMCGVCTVLQKYSQIGYIDLDKIKTAGTTKRRLRTGEEGEEKEEELMFNPDDYKTSYETTWPVDLVHVVETKPQERTEEDLHTIKLVMSSLPSFRRYTKKMQDLLSKVVRYSKFGPKRVIIRKGHIGHSFYFIFSGAVQVVFDTEDISVFTKPEISVLKKGQVFGEIALLRDSVRNATIICAEETELLIVDREEFNEFGLYDLFMNELAYRIDFLGHQRLLSTWPKKDIEDLCYVSRIEEYAYNKVIVKDARKSEWLYCVCKGCCEILRLVDLTKCEEFQNFVPPERYPSKENNMPPLFLDMDSALQYLKKNWAPPRTNEQVKANLELAMQSGTSQGDRSARRTVSSMSASQDVATEKGSATVLEIKNPSGSNSMTSQSKPSSPRKIPPHIAHAAVSKKRQRKTGSTEPDTEYDYVGIGVFVKVDNLRPGDVFGLNNLFETPQFLSLVSKGSEVIRIPRTKFKDLGGEITMAKSRKLIRSYPSDAELCRNFLKQNTWNMFKQELVDIVRADFPNTPEPSGTQRGCKDYFRRSATSPTCKRYPQPRIFYSPDQLCGNGDSKERTRAKSAAPRLVSGGLSTPRTRPKTATFGHASGRGIFPVSTELACFPKTARN